MAETASIQIKLANGTESKTATYSGVKVDATDEAILALSKAFADLSSGTLAAVTKTIKREITIS